MTSPELNLTIALIGRPNVGKSTLFNRLVGRKLALVDNTPGVTRDRREGEGRLADLNFTIIDTAGLEEAAADTLERRMREQTEAAIIDCDICMFMIDARVGVTPMDRHFAESLRRANKPIILLANKAEGGAGEEGAYDAYSLGLGDPVAVSAEHGEGLGSLYDALKVHFDAAQAILWNEEGYEADEDEEDTDKAMKIAVVGRPNAGKSTLINHLLGEERLLTGPEAGITRDSISVDWEWEGRKIRLFDTAGIRRKARVQEKLEKLSVADGLRAIRFAEVVIVTLDATMPFEKQDLSIAGLVIREGRSLVLALNKWDLIKDRQKAMADIREQAERLLPEVRGVPIVPISGLMGYNIDALFQAVEAVHKTWNIRIGTSRLNSWLEEVTIYHQPPAVAGRRIRIRYITQAKSRPPTFIVFASRTDALPESYKRYLLNSLREEFELPGVPLRLNVREGDNPYKPKKTRKIH